MSNSQGDFELYDSVGRLSEFGHDTAREQPIARNINYFQEINACKNNGQGLKSFQPY